MNRSLGASWCLQGLVALVLAPMIFAKLAGHAQARSLFTVLGMEPGGRYLVAGLELVALLLLLVPVSVGWGAILGWGLMTGALIAHLTELGMRGPMLPMCLAALFNWLGCTAILVLRRREIEFIRHMCPDEEEGG